MMNNLCLLGILWLWQPAWGAPSPKVTVLMIQWRGETSAEKGFKDELRKAVGGVEFLTFNADQDKERLLNYLHTEFRVTASRIDYVYSFGTTASETVKRVLPEVGPRNIVHIINIVTDPVAAKLAETLSAAGPNRIVGCHLVPLEIQLQNALKVIKFKNIGFIFNPREENSNIQLAQMTGMSEKMGFTVVPIRIKPEKDDLEDAIKRIEEGKANVDCVYLISESFLVSNAAWVVRRLNAARVPTIAAIEQYMQEGALIGTIVSYDELGRLVAKVVAKDLKSSHAVNNFPVVLDPSPDFMINLSTANSLNIKINEKALAGAKFIKP